MIVKELHTFWGLSDAKMTKKTQICSIVLMDDVSRCATVSKLRKWYRRLAISKVYGGLTV